VEGQQDQAQVPEEEASPHCPQGHGQAPLLQVAAAEGLQRPYPGFHQVAVPIQVSMLPTSWTE